MSSGVVAVLRVARRTSPALRRVGALPTMNGGPPRGGGGVGSVPPVPPDGGVGTGRGRGRVAAVRR